LSLTLYVSIVVVSDVWTGIVVVSDVTIAAVVVWDVVSDLVAVFNITTDVIVVPNIIINDLVVSNVIIVIVVVANDVTDVIVVTDVVAYVDVVTTNIVNAEAEAEVMTVSIIVSDVAINNVVGCVAQFAERRSCRRTDPVLRSACSRRVTTMWVNRPLQVSQLGQLSLSSFRGR